jgi:hypothetical protein
MIVLPVTLLADREALRIRMISDDAALGFLTESIEYWQITVLLYQAGPEGIEGTNSLIRRIHKKRISDVTIFNFIKSATAKRYYLKMSGNKKNTHRYRLSDEILSKLNAFFNVLYGGEQPGM